MKPHVVMSANPTSAVEFTEMNNNEGHPAFGSLWEQMVLGNIRGLFPEADVFFFRTADGTEMDFVVSMRGKTVAIECKAGTAPSVGKGTYSAIDTIRPDFSYVVAPVDEPYPLNEKLSVIRLADLGDMFTGLMEDGNAKMAKSKS